MRNKIKLLPEAQLDIYDIIDWYDKQKIGLGRRFYESLKSKLNYIKKYPLHCQIVYRDVRNISLDKYPYQVHYKLEEQNHLIIVFAVTNTSRDPKVWQRKS
jgi:plasmid stabilization system protein ParE